MAPSTAPRFAACGIALGASLLNMYVLLPWLFAVGRPSFNPALPVGLPLAMFEGLAHACFYTTMIANRGNRPAHYLKHLTVGRRVYFFVNLVDLLSHGVLAVLSPWQLCRWAHAAEHIWHMSKEIDT